MISTPRPATWHEYKRSGDNAAITITRSAYSNNVRHMITSLEASLDDTGTAEIDLYGLERGVGQLDLSATGVLNLTTDIFTFANHGLVEDEEVLFWNGSGTAPTGLTDLTRYFVIATDANSFQLEATLGGGAINMSGTQASFSTDAFILPLNRSWNVYDHLELDFSSPLQCEPNKPLAITVEAAGAGLQTIVNVSGFEG